MFGETIQLFNECCTEFVKHASYNSHLAAEVQQRLHQLQFIMDRVKGLEISDEKVLRGSLAAITAHVAKSQTSPGTVSVSEIPADLMQNVYTNMGTAAVEIRALTEQFYHSAARIRAIARHEDKPLPNLAFECKGVRDVRNHLIEHPEGTSSRIFAQGFGYGGPQGPVIKGGRPAGEEANFPDRGLYPNAEEFRDNLLGALKRIQNTQSSSID